MVDERHFIRPCIEGFLAQDYPGHLLEIVVVDGGSVDGSDEIVREMAAEDGRIRLIDNPRRVPAAAANEGVAAARGEVLCFLSAHGEPDPTYVRTSVDVLLDTGAAGVGGQYLHEGTEPRSRAIGLAMASPFGMASPHRTSASRREVDTISHPTFWKSAILTAGGYDETLHRNEDYELNYRVRRTVGPLVFAPEIRSVYRPRRDLRSLWRQFHAYGIGKAEVLRRHPDSLQARHAVPPHAIAALVASPGLAASRGGRRMLPLGAAGYAAVIVAAVARARPRRHDASLATFVVALPVMHVAWGSGVVRGLLMRRV